MLERMFGLDRAPNPVVRSSARTGRNIHATGDIFHAGFECLEFVDTLTVDFYTRAALKPTEGFLP